MEKIYKELFKQFLDGAIDEESKGRYNSAISNYYKALSTLCSLIIYRKNKKTANSHQEIDMFMSILFPEIRKSIEGLYKTYTGTYQTLKEEEDCSDIKNGIKKVIKMAGIEEEFKETLEKYKEINDIIIFGSFVKGKYAPKDIDIAIVADRIDVSKIGEIKEKININDIDIEVIKSEQIYQTRLGLNLISEGFSIKNNKFLRDKLGLSPMKIYTYEIKELTQTKKVLFGRGLNQIMKTVKANKLGSGSIMVPVEQTSKFEDFLETWGLKYKTKEYLVL